jgi:hypothetical protein
LPPTGYNRGVRPDRVLTEATDTEKTAGPALDAFESPLFNNLTLVLDRYFVHRLRVVNRQGRQCPERGRRAGPHDHGPPLRREPPVT